MKPKFKIDYWLAAPALILYFIGLTVVSSINIVYIRSQVTSLIIALVIFIVLTLINFQALRNLKMSIYIISLILLMVILIAGIESRGAVRWIDLFGIRVQFSEILKPFLSIAFAAYISEISKITFKIFLSIILLILPILFLVFYQPDLGSALIYAGTFVIALIIIGFPIYYFLIILMPFLFLTPFLWNLLHDYQRQRIITFLNPSQDPLGTSYNSIQALIAVGSGMIFGKGLGEGTQSSLRFLPERHTDFIFSSISESLGFVGSMIVIFVFVILLSRIYIIFSRSKNSFERTFLACGFLFIFLQFLCNIGMNIGILPIVGITLPFVSYGGSSLLANFIFLAFASSISISNKITNVLEIK